MDMIQRFESIVARIEAAARRSHRQPSAVRLLAVSKRHTAEKVAQLAQYWAGSGGRPVFGENYVQEAGQKKAEVSLLIGDVDVEWHFIGHLQTNKAKEVAGLYRLVHSVDSLKLGVALQKAWALRAQMTPRGLDDGEILPQDILVQVNIGRERQKSGVLPEDLEKLLTGLADLPGIAVQGLMCMPPDMEEAEDTRPFFRQLKELRDDLRAGTGLALPELSMGMSHDFEIAVEEGATIVRVGTDIFGERPRLASD
jgi:pyridoxal phosphate enzyme (YggS family)